MAYSSSSHQQNEEHHAFSWIEPPGKRRKVSESSRLFDVFINHRGPDVKQTLARQLYNSLQELELRAFLDSEERELGDSFPPTIETAIRSASVHIAIFSERYAESPWCLAELDLMSDSKAKIIPVFYGVQPSELRYIEKGVYAKAFTDYEEKGRYLDRLEKWKDALRSASLITGAFQFNNLECASSPSGFELKNSEEYKNIVLAVQKEVPRTKPLVVAKHPVGLHKLVKDFERRCLQELVRDFDSQCGMNEGCTEKVKIVGIFGMGGVGKTTLSKELFNQKSSRYSRACFLFDVREASARREIPSLQKKLLKDLFNEIPNDFLSAEEGRSYLRDRLRRGSFLSFLIVLDDIDHAKQLDDLLLRDLLNNSGNSLVIVTTRDEGVLINAAITNRYNLKALNKDDGKELFCWHSCGQPHAPPGYEALVDAFVDRCQGLPLSFQVLGRHVYGRTDFFWRLELHKLHSTLPGDIRDILKISFDGLDSQEKQIFLDIACFFVDRSKSIALRVWEGSRSGWSAQHALETLKSKCLVEEIRISSLSLDGLESQDRIELRMHDHLRDLGREMANEPGHPHRLWRHQNDKSLEFQSILAQTKGRCFHSIVDNTMNCRITFFIGESDNRYELSTSLLWLQLEYLNSRVHPSIPSWIPLQNLQCLRISGGHLKRLWPRNVQAPTQLKELHIYQTFVEKFPDLLGISNKLEKVVLDTEHMPIKGCSLSGSMRMNLRTFNSDIEGKTWKFLSVQEFKSDGKMALYMDFNYGGETKNIKASVSRRENLEFRGEKLITKLLISGNNCPSLESLQVHDMGNLIEVDLTSLKTLSCVEVTDCKKFKRLSATSDHTNLVVFNISQCPEFKELCFGRESCVEKIAIKNCLKRVAEISDLGKLVQLTISECRMLQELRFVHLNSMERITIENCTQLKSVSGISDVKKLVEFNLHECPQLQEFNFSYLSCLEIIRIYKCSSLKSVSGIFDLAKLVEFNMSECCELQEISFGGQNCLERVTIQYCKKLKTVSGMLDLGKLVILNICDCPELEGMPALLGPSCPERIIINECGKLNCLDLGTCQNLKSVPLLSDQMTLAELKISEYPLPVKISEYPLQELSLAQMSNQEKIIIENCNNLKSVSGISDLRKLVDLSISQCGELLSYVYRVWTVWRELQSIAVGT